MGAVLATLRANATDLPHFPVRPADLAHLLDLLRAGTVSHSAAKRIFAEMASTGERAEQVAHRLGLIQESDADTLVAWIDEVIAEQPTEWARFRSGETKLQGVLVGAVMKKSKGRADPRRVNQLLSERRAG
jgi:aspartyl-tRNA(Asn)/glutamyl-tRNA(Gln) amidotransferase subunit B